MPTQEQMKAIAIRTALATGSDKFIYGAPFNGKQALMDMANFAVVEYFTKDMAMEATKSLFAGMSDDMKEQIVRVALDVGQDMLMQRFGNNRSRPLMEAVVMFALAEFGEDQITSRKLI